MGITNDPCVLVSAIYNPLTLQSGFFRWSCVNKFRTAIAASLSHMEVLEAKLGAKCATPLQCFLSKSYSAKFDLWISLLPV
jgi:hypothetical protein